VLAAAEAAAKESPENSAWPLLRAKALIALGRGEEARRGLETALASDPRAVRLRWLDRELALQTGRADDAARRLDEIRGLLRGRSWGYWPPADIVAFGRAALVLGADPKEVLDQVFAVAQKADPRLRDVYLARGEVALDKHDFALAAKAADEGLKQLPDDPDLLVLRAKAFAHGAREEASISVVAALKRNPRHVPALLLRAEASRSTRKPTPRRRRPSTGSMRLIPPNPKRGPSGRFSRICAVMRQGKLWRGLAR
jgi:tetratricopeptide (TPR) repeat protein